MPVAHRGQVDQLNLAAMVSSAKMLSHFVPRTGIGQKETSNAVMSRRCASERRMSKAFPQRSARTLSWRHELDTHAGDTSSQTPRQLDLHAAELKGMPD